MRGEREREREREREKITSRRGEDPYGNLGMECGEGWGKCVSETLTTDC